MGSATLSVHGFKERKRNPHIVMPPLSLPFSLSSPQDPQSLRHPMPQASVGKMAIIKFILIFRPGQNEHTFSMTHLACSDTKLQPQTEQSLPLHSAAAMQSTACSSPPGDKQPESARVHTIPSQLGKARQAGGPANTHSCLIPSQQESFPT